MNNHSTQQSTRLPIPLKKTRLVLFTLIFCMSLIGEVAAIHYVIESNSKKKAARKALPGGTLHINTTNIEDTLIVLFVAADLLCSQTGGFIAFILKDWFIPYWPRRLTMFHPRDGMPFSTRMLKFEAWYLVINLMAILAVLIPATLFAATRNVVISGTTASGMTISQSAIQQGLVNAGISGNIYYDFFPVRFAIISNWINVFFTILGTIASFTALSKRRKYGTFEKQQEIS